MKEVIIKLYDFDELSDKAKEHAISEFRDMVYLYANENATCLRKFDGYEYFYSEEHLREFIIANEYMFTGNGELYEKRKELRK